MRPLSGSDAQPASAPPNRDYLVCGKEKRSDPPADVREVIEKNMRNCQNSTTQEILLGVLVVVAQLSDQERITIDAIDRAMLLGDAA